MARKVWLLGGIGAGGLALAAWWWSSHDPGDPALAALVYARPSVPIVFTSRSEAASFLAAAPAGEEFHSPGQRLWQARAGRLRLLTPHGTVHELTWNKPFPDGTTLIDVMTPTVSPDGTRIVFAGRKGGSDHGHFRLYEIGVDGCGLRALTGGPSDSGCVALPPMRFAADSKTTVLSDAERRAIDYDDVDPIYLNYAQTRLCFVSSRMPDLGRHHTRRSTTLWLMHGDGSNLRPLTANRNNDRWPFLMASHFIAFSLWSRNREVITADERDIRPHDPEQASATEPTDTWLGAFTQSIGSQFGLLVKPAIPVWRPRPLFNGKIVFMTPAADSGHDARGVLRVVQADPGLIGNVPSARPKEHPLPRRNESFLQFAPAHDGSGRPLSLATPSPCPPGHVVLSGAPLEPGQDVPAPGRYGLYRMSDNWAASSAPAPAASQASLQLVFDDPDFVDAEPVAVYVRPLKLWDQVPEGTTAGSAGTVTLDNGTIYHGPGGQVFNSSLYLQQVADLPGQKTDADAGPIFDAPPHGSLKHIAVYASRRDRFDDPVKPRIPGGWELLRKVPVDGNSFGAWLPAGVPTVLAGFNAAGKITRWTTAPRDSEGRQATLYAFAGDHYSAVRAGGMHFCLGCHPGHSSLTRNDHRHAEKLK